MVLLAKFNNKPLPNMSSMTLNVNSSGNGSGTSITLDLYHQTFRYTIARPEDLGVALVYWPSSDWHICHDLVQFKPFFQLPPSYPVRLVTTTSTVASVPVASSFKRIERYPVQINFFTLG
ncbi:hypothetical protein CERZMDRAFT_99439 [Cercospora zeae-maydis SCOH1-5]|uniref:Uncharacterized protein n=1 Tax=Cercospora zeae-maydis SCOH1-5 TaxID=717836 RepID=A0A6A6FAI1_9PEZI|nr:hypothetical protein CERZMDRAFT_99439 [Cercospora zeae-maydis SCOH1-5]